MIEWIKAYPQEEGDFLWVSVWGCGCCVKQSGIANICDVEGADANNMPKINYRTEDGKHLGISWEGKKPYFFEDKPVIDGWMKIDLRGLKN